MAMVLPRQIGYDASLPQLPADTTSVDVVLQPVNNTSFGPSSLVEFQLPSRGFMDPSSLYLRYRVTISNSGAAAAPATLAVRGCPATAFFQKLETYAGSQQLESQNNYNILMNDLINLTYSVADKYGSQYALGYTTLNTAGADTLGGNQFSLDGRLIGALGAGASTSFFVAIPLQCVLSNAEKLVPLEFMQNIRLVLTTDTATNVITSAGATVSFSLSNMELCYSSVQFNSDVLGMIKGFGGDDGSFYVKSSSWYSAGATISAGTVGNVELQYSHRLASIKSIFAHFASTSANMVNGIFDSCEPSTTSGTYQFTINSTPYPQREISTTLNKAGAIMELKKALGQLTSKHNSQSINFTEFNRVAGDTTTLQEPAKFILGVNTERLSTSDVLLSGVSSQNANVTLRCNIGGAPAEQLTAYCICNADVLIKIDPAMKQAIAMF